MSVNPVHSNYVSQTCNYKKNEDIHSILSNSITTENEIDLSKSSAQGLKLTFIQLLLTHLCYKSMLILCCFLGIFHFLYIFCLYIFFSLDIFCLLDIHQMEMWAHKILSPNHQMLAKNRYYFFHSKKHFKNSFGKSKSFIQGVPEKMVR